jgi:hypothetical protein
MQEPKCGGFQRWRTCIERCRAARSSLSSLTEAPAAGRCRRWGKPAASRSRRQAVQSTSRAPRVAREGASLRRFRKTF